MRSQVKQEEYEVVAESFSSPITAEIDLYSSRKILDPVSHFICRDMHRFELYAFPALASTTCGEAIQRSKQ
jgi:hypothetical protein